VDKKRIFAIAMLFILIFNLSGCAKSTTEIRLQQQLEQMKKAHEIQEKNSTR
jgi:hypothetical protein